MDEEKERELDEYMDKIISRGMAENPLLEPSPGMRWVLWLTARYSKGLPREPGVPHPPVDHAEITQWMTELRRQSAADLEHAAEMRDYCNRKFRRFD